MRSMREALDPRRPERVVNLERTEGDREWKIQAGGVDVGFLKRYGGRGHPRYLAHGVLTHARADGSHRDHVVRDYLRELRKELRLL